MMNRPYSKKRRTREKKAHPYRIVTLLIMLGMVAGTIGYVGWPKSQDATMPSFSARFNTWWAERKARIATKLAASQEKMNQVAAVAKPKTKSAPETLHFEFYSMLPNGGEPIKESRESTIFNHDTLEREFAKTVVKTAYVIQGGIYNNAASADKTREALAEEGLAAKVVKAYMGERLVYRIQVGPYQEKDQINDAQSKLAAHGVHGVLRKMEEKLA